MEPDSSSLIPAAVPRHVAIIMDGNGRWARQRSLPRVAGHRQGAEALRELLPACIEEGVRYLTIYAFSSENWERPESEVTDLIGLLKYYLGREVDRLHAQGVRIRVIGDAEQFGSNLAESIYRAEEKTRYNDRLHLTVALSYGGRQELCRAFQHMLDDVQNGTLQRDAISPDVIQSHLYTSELPDPDLLIRTGGEQRVSNFLLWQLAYTEMYFTDTLWPDFSPEFMKEALADYGQRERRYGRTYDDEQVPDSQALAGQRS